MGEWVEIFCTRPDLPRRLPSFLYSGCRGDFPESKAAGGVTFFDHDILCICGRIKVGVLYNLEGKTRRMEYAYAPNNLNVLNYVFRPSVTEVLYRQMFGRLLNT